MLTLIGLGLNDEKDISIKGLEIVKNADIVYLENYTSSLQCSKQALDKFYGKEIQLLEREVLEDATAILSQAAYNNIVLLIVGDVFSATTHISLFQEAKQKGIEVKVVHNASVLNAIGITGLELYKFGKTTSLPKWTKNYSPMSFIETVKENQSIEAHTLLLIDIGLNFSSCKEQLKESGFKNEKIIVCSRLGVKSKIFYDSLDKVPENKIEAPYCIIIPGSLSENEKESLELVVNI